MSTVTLQHLSKRFGRHVTALDEVDLEIHESEFMVFLGPSGCGKTTALRIIAGLEEPTAGTVLIGDRDVTYLPPRQRNVSMVFQNYAVWPHMTVAENIAFPLGLRKQPEAEIRRTTDEMAGIVGISGLLERYPDQLSGGQRQRVALARALAVKPEVFLMDEPLSNLDAKLRLTMRTELKAIHQQTGATTIFVTHDQAEAMSMADRIAVIRDGRIVQTGTPDDIYFRSADTFVAGFIGMPPMNLIEVAVEHTPGGPILVHPAFRCALAPEGERLPGDGLGDRVMLGVRPEDIRLAGAGGGTFQARAEVVEPQGSHQVVAIRLDGQTVKLAAPPSPAVAPGQSLDLTFAPEHLRFFNPGTGKALA